MQTIQSSWKRTFFTLWGGQAVSLVTSAIVQFAIIWDLTARTGSAAVLSVASLIGYLPMALFSPFIGALVDRWNRKAIMIAADMGIALVTLGLALFAYAGPLPLWAVYAALFLRAVGSAFHSPCLSAVTPQIVPEAELARCGGYSSAVSSVSFILSPALAAALYAALPLAPILLLDLIGAAFGIGTVAISRIPRLPRGDAVRLHVLRDAKEGLVRLRQSRGLYYLVLISSLFSLAYVPMSSLFPLMCMGYFGGTTRQAGFAEMAFAGGMLLGGLVLGAWGGTKNKLRTMVPAVVLMALTAIVSGFLPPTGFPVFAALSFVMGFAGPFFSSLFMAMLQAKIPPDLLGRILGVSSSMMALACPLGLALSGLFADRIGIQRWFLVSGVMTLVCAALCVVVRDVREVDSVCVTPPEAT